jgi:peptidoglycan/LPS O-acetylase OafA/YrhL
LGRRGGRLSFSLFLTNTLTAVVWFGLVRAVEQNIALPTAASWALWAAAIPATIVAAWVFERVVDAPLQRWIKGREAKSREVALPASPVQA